ncbi:uncharacterized protein LOC133783619 isoform X2 [Humulus lupulus]|uniref:uncharacterized protein LOC133783619 isoform X2 n=1 Tax=Humulus lupulus TaxID=3486 RepID=UPI002B404511|nr:uncharacterized protein LOC133783619 isoform X2 [Humulus lupulus]
MGKAPSLTTLCLEVVKDEILRGDDLMPVIRKLPTDLFDRLLLRLPPLPLLKLGMAMGFGSEEKEKQECDEAGQGNGRKRGRDFSYEDKEEQEYVDAGHGNGRKRGRDFSSEEKEEQEYDDADHENGRKCGMISGWDKAWKHLYELRWPKLVNQNEYVDWLQIYWETHLQNCLDQAAEIALLPLFDESLGEIGIPDSLLKHIGYENYMKVATCDYSKLYFHCREFGRFARCLRIQNNICGREISHLLRNCKLQSLALWWIRSEEQITGWLSEFIPRFSRSGPMSLGFGKSLQSLRALNIRGNELDEDDALGLRYAMVHMPHLELLDISDNPIQDRGIRNLLPYFIEASEKCTPFTDLYLENCDISNGGVIELINTLLTFKKPLESLSIADNVLGSQVAAALGNLLSTSIQILNISGIELGSPGFEDLEKSITQTQELKLVEITISKNRGGVAAANFLSTLLLRAPKLETINAAYNWMPVEASYIVCSAIKAAKGNLGLFNLRGNHLDGLTTHGLTEIQQAGKPVLNISLLPILAARHDDDP